MLCWQRWENIFATGLTKVWQSVGRNVTLQPLHCTNLQEELVASVVSDSQEKNRLHSYVTCWDPPPAMFGFTDKSFPPTHQLHIVAVKNELRFQWADRRNTKPGWLELLLCGCIPLPCFDASVCHRTDRELHRLVDHMVRPQRPEAQ